jgi:predicted site-specific integrase-resolvase
MTRTWTVCRQPSPRRDGERRWDQAYQLLVRWTERGDLPWPARSPRRCLMRAAVYARVSTTRQAQAQTIEQQLDRLRAAVAERGWRLEEQHVYRDDGYSGAGLSRPGLDRLRDQAAL